MPEPDGTREHRRDGDVGARVDDDRVHLVAVVRGKDAVERTHARSLAGTTGGRSALVGDRRPDPLAIGV